MEMKLNFEFVTPMSHLLARNHRKAGILATVPGEVSRECRNE